VGAFLLSLLATPLALLNPVPLKIAVDSVIGSDPLPSFLQAFTPGFLMASKGRLLVFAALLMVGIAAVSQLQVLVASFVQTYTGEKLLLRFQTRLFRHAQRLSLCYHDRAGTTDSLYRIQYDAPAIQWIASDGFIPLVTAGFTLVGMIYVTARMDMRLALVALLVSPVLFVLARWFRRRLRDRWRAVKEVELSALSVVQETLTSLRVVKAFGREGHEEERFLDRYGEGVRARIRANVAESGLAFLVGVTMAGGTATVLFIGIRHVLSGALTLGELLVIMAYIGQLYAPLKTIGGGVTTVQKSLASAERAFTLLDETPEVEERLAARPIERARGAVEFDAVSFAYEGREPVLEDVSFAVGPGTRVGITGKTGAGKSTLLSLLTRFYDPQAGRILLDGIDIREYRLSDLREQFAIVLQDTILFSTSIAENIAYGRPEAALPEIEAAARSANIHDFVTGLDHGYDTVVGERGLLLSGGERQRVALARAFLKDAPILLLDEPTSAVDTGTETLIMEAMGRLMVGRTTFMIAHRLSTLVNCDRRLRLEDGRLRPETVEAPQMVATIRVRGAPSVDAAEA